MDALIDVVTELVVQELARGNAPAPPQAAPGKRKLLLCPARGTDLSGPVYEALRRLDDVTWLIPPGCPAELADLLGRPWRPAQGHPEEVVRQVQAVILPSLTLELLPRMAILLQDLPAVQFAVAALVQGTPVLAAQEEVDRFRRHASQLPSGLTRVVQEHVRAVQEMGVRLLPATAIGDHLCGPKPQTHGRRDVITHEDVVRLQTRFLDVPPGAIVTPLALETARMQGIEVRYQ